MLPLRFFLALLIGFFLSQPAFAKEAAPHRHAGAKARAHARGLFWKVQGKKGTVYLVGSIHMLDRSMYPLPEGMEKAFDASSALAVEANVAGDEASQQAQQAQLMQAAMYPKGDGGLKKHITSKTYEAAEAALKTNNVSLAQLDQLKPWFVAMMIEILAAQKAGLDKNLGLDVHFLNEATQSDKPIIELESVAFQIHLFDSLPVSQQEAMLYSSALDYGRFESDIKEMMDAWRRGDAEKMTRIVHQDEDKDPTLKPVMDALLTKRNIGMADKIAGFLEQGKSVFVVVGAGHLVGSDGVAQLLRNKGYTVEQL